MSGLRTRIGFHYRSSAVGKSFRIGRLSENRMLAVIGTRHVTELSSPTLCHEVQLLNKKDFRAVLAFAHVAAQLQSLLER